MDNIPITEWEDESYVDNEHNLLRLPNISMDTLELCLEDCFAAQDPIYGLIAPYSHENVEFNIRCAARIQDRFPDTKVYTAVPTYKTYERIKTIFRAGFSNIVIPQYLGRVQYDHYFQFIQNRDLDKMTLHVAGGKFDSELWNRDNWSWSREGL